jgi:hypothetical protein
MAEQSSYGRNWSEPQMSDVQNVITATPVSEDKRISFLPKHFGVHFVSGEATIYAWAATLSADYAGGLWNYVELSNGGFYVSPATPEKLRVRWPDNYFDGEVSADAAGIIITLYALNHLAAKTLLNRFVDKYHSLREFALTHPEAAYIMSAID